jgi:heme exporter protein B
MGALWLQQALAICAKDIRLGLRERTAVTSVLLFSVTSIVIVGFALSGSAAMADASTPILWVVLFFAAFSGLEQAFVEEEESGTALALRVVAYPEAVYVGKLLYNVVLLTAVGVVIVPLFLAVTGLPIPHAGRFVGVVMGGIAALGSSATIVGAIIAKAHSHGALFGALGFPIVLPLLMMAVVATRRAIGVDGDDWSWMRDVGGLASYAVMMVAASVLVFPSIWEST